MTQSWLSLPDEFFDDLDNCAAYFAVHKVFGDQIWWFREGSFGIPLHPHSLTAAGDWCLLKESQYRESLRTTSHRLERHPKFSTCMSPLESTATAIVRERHDLDGTDFTDLDIFDEELFPDLAALAYKCLDALLEIALSVHKG